MATLLEKALARPVPNRADRKWSRTSLDEEESLVLAMAWLRGEITFTQASAATGIKGSPLYGLLAVTLRRAYLDYRINVDMNQRR